MTAPLYPWYEVRFYPAADARTSGCPDDWVHISIPISAEADEMGDQQRMRASDRDRQQVVDRLRSAMEDGRLTMEEYVDRMEVAYQSATYGDLAPLCADLPVSTPVTAGPATAATAPPAAFSSARYLAGLPTVLRFLWIKWMAVVSVNVVIWALVSGTGGRLAYPWPVWVAGPYGAALFAVSAGVMLFRRSRPPAARPRPS